MNKLLFTLMIFAFTLASFAQTKEQRQEALNNKTKGIETDSGKITINGYPLKDIDVEYSRIVGTSKFLSSKVTIQIDFGQETTFFSQNRDTQVIDGNGKKIEFTSMIDALNFMNENGYEFLQAYAMSLGNQNVYHYLLKKKRE
jgi:hypothetical protein